MNREILFRGKRTDNDEWVYGRLLAEDVIVPLNQEFEVEAKRIWGCDLTAHIVAHKTVGQFTGLCDKNGTKIFEGDIIDWGFGLYVVVEYIKEYARFAGVNGDSIFPLEDTDDKEKRIEVVGNVYDNPDLLK